MNFQAELAQAVMAGRKTVTRRLVSDNPRSPWWREQCALEPGRDVAVCPGRGKHAIGRVRIVSVSRERLSATLGTFGEMANAFADREAQREGFRDAPSFHLAWLKINGGYDETALVWRIEFEVAEIAVCQGCGHYGDDCVCWYLTETAKGERDEVAA